MRGQSKNQLFVRTRSSNNQAPKLRDDITAVHAHANGTLFQYRNILKGLDKMDKDDG